MSDSIFPHADVMLAAKNAGNITSPKSVCLTGWCIHLAQMNDVKSSTENYRYQKKANSSVHLQNTCFPSQLGCFCCVQVFSYLHKVWVYKYNQFNTMIVKKKKINGWQHNNWKLFGNYWNHEDKCIFGIK